jgi:hypothetical protein
MGMSGRVQENSVCRLRSLSEEIIAALFGGREHLGELRRASQVREHWTILQVGVGAVMPRNRTLEEPERDVFLPAKGEAVGKPVPVFSDEGRWLFPAR